MKARQLENLGIPAGNAAKMAKWMAVRAREGGLDHKAIKERLTALAADPAAFTDDPYFGELARQLALRQHADGNAAAGFIARDEPAPWQQWGTDLDEQSIDQMRWACRLPVAVRGALMPDAHVGYGLPIGGVLAVDNAVIPYAVGVDIACRMKLTVLDLPPATLDKRPDWLARAIEAETCFGVGGEFDKRHRRQHAVLDEDWAITDLTRHLKDKAAAQLGTSGSGNHFVEFGTLTLEKADLGLAAGTYLALLSHSGSRGSGAQVADYYSRLAQRLHPELPREMSRLAWLDLNRSEGQEYWQAMHLMGRYAAANHALIHQHVARHLGAGVLLDIENHHNFAWEEEHDIEPGGRHEEKTPSPQPSPEGGGGGMRKLIVHRKGATPAGAGVVGIIPGSMAAPGFVVRGKGSSAALNSAAHGAGRAMSRTKARESFRWATVRPVLEERGVRLLSAGIDEVPFAYKDIEKVMAAQADLVKVVARFDPKLVKMAPEGEKPED